MVIHRRQSRNQFDKDVYLVGYVISRVSSVKFLGLYIEDLIKVLSKFMFMLPKLKSQLTEKPLYLI